MLLRLKPCRRAKTAGNKICSDFKAYNQVGRPFFLKTYFTHSWMARAYFLCHISQLEPDMEPRGAWNHQISFKIT